MSRLWPVLAGLAAGLVAGALWTFAQPDRFRADARLLVRPPSASLVPAVQTLAGSSVLRTNVQQTLKLASTPAISAHAGDGGVLTVAATASSRDRARQIDAEAVVVLQQRASQRFPKAALTVLDPAHAAKQTSPNPWRNFLIAVGAGLGVGILFTVLRPRAGQRAPTSRVMVDPQAERRFQRRVDEVAKRERALARRAGQLAAREQELDVRTRELDAREDELEGRPVPAVAPEPEPVAPPAPEPAPAPPPAPAAPSRGGWNLEDLESRVAASTATAEAREQWETYLFFLRQHAASDGTLPAQFDGLVRDVFGDLV